MYTYVGFDGKGKSVDVTTRMEELDKQFRNGDIRYIEVTDNTTGTMERVIDGLDAFEDWLATVERHIWLPIKGRECEPPKVKEAKARTKGDFSKFHSKNFKEKSAEEQDEVINPKHYQIIPPGNYPEGLEYMDIMKYALAEKDGYVGHLLGQIFKYSFRLGGKDDVLQEAKKIQWYANKLVSHLESK